MAELDIAGLEDAFSDWPSRTPVVAVTPHGDDRFAIESAAQMTATDRDEMVLHLRPLNPPEPEPAPAPLDHTRRPKSSDVYKHVLYWATRITRNDGRLTADSSMDLDLAHDELEKALNAWHSAEEG